jgi:hypothetical protein
MGHPSRAMQRRRQREELRRRVAEADAAARERAKETLRTGVDVRLERQASRRKKDGLLPFPLVVDLAPQIELPAPPKNGIRPVLLDSARANRMLAFARAGFPLDAVAVAGGLSENTLRSYLERDDAECFVVFQRHFNEALRYFDAVCHQAIFDGVQIDPEFALEVEARRNPETWGKARGGEAPAGGAILGVRVDALLELALEKARPLAAKGPVSLEIGRDGVARPALPDPRGERPKP